MKKIQILAASLLAASLCITGCKTANSKQSTDSVATEIDTLAVDSMGFHEKQDSTVECTISIENPQGDDSLALAVKNFIAAELAKVYMPRNNADGEEMLRRYPLYTGNTTDCAKMLDFYGQGTMRYLMETRKDMAQYYQSSEPMPPLYQMIKVKKAAETSAYVTYSITDEAYLGGAHGSYTFYYVNIDKKTCKPLYNTVDSARVKELQPMLRKGVLWYLKESGVEGVTNANMNEFIILPEDGIIPLPAHTPWVQNDSLNFVYQQYEIASYAVGPVGFNIAIKDIEPYLTSETKAMLGK